MRHKTLSACLETCRGVHLLISKSGISCLGVFWPVQGQHNKNKTPSNISSTNTVVMVLFTMKKDQNKQQIFTFMKLNPANV